MPLADAARGVPLLLQKLCNGQPTWLDQVGRIPVQHAILQTAAPAISASQDAIAGWSADGRRRVHVGEAHAFRCQFGGIWHGDLRVRVIAGKVALAKVVSKNVDNIRFFGRGENRMGGAGKAESAKELASGLHRCYCLPWFSPRASYANIKDWRIENNGIP